MSSTYEGEDLEALADMPNYHAWIMRWFEPHLRGRVIEYGAGTGTLSAHIRPFASQLTLVEPSENLLPHLSGKFRGDPTITIAGSSLEQHATTQRSDSAEAIIMVNVLEHIEDDYAALRELHRVLVPGGHLLLFMPALSFLMSDLDRKIGHYRRYHRPETIELLQNAGFSVTQCRYFDIPGVLPWLVINRWMRATGFNPTLARLYDRAVVPIARLIEAVPPPFGKNIIAIARRLP
jgi:SAM-dependent methyltransferase